MDVEDTIERIATLIREVAAEAERRGEQKALDRIRAAIGVVDGPGIDAPGPAPVRPRQSDDAEAEPGAAVRRRAPKGSVGNLVDRALASGSGLTLAEVGATAENDLERMIAATSIRAHLKKGEAAGLYREEAGRWFRVAAAEEAIDAPPAAESPDQLWPTDSNAP